MHPDMPKIECPFVRKTYKINKRDWEKHGSKMNLRTPEVYLVTPEINPTCSWVFEEENVFASEKLHGTNVLVDIQDRRLVGVQNRKNVIDITRILGKGDGSHPSGRILEGLLYAADMKLIKDNSVQYGELIGPKFNLNMHKLTHHLWFPFEKARESLRYKSFDRFPKEFYGWSEWFRTGLKSLIYCRLNKIPFSQMWGEDVPFTEGIVIHQPRKDNLEMPRMSKLRRDMYPWYYWDKIEIYDLDESWINYAHDKGIKDIKGYHLGENHVEEREE